MDHGRAADVCGDGFDLHSALFQHGFRLPLPEVHDIAFRRSIELFAEEQIELLTGNAECGGNLRNTHIVNQIVFDNPDGVGDFAAEIPFRALFAEFGQQLHGESGETGCAWAGSASRMIRTAVSSRAMIRSGFFRE